MAIQFLLGASGTGKTTYIYQQMIDKSQEKEKHPVIYMLPEQANMTAEQDLIHMHPNGGTMDITVLSFTRLAFKIFDELNVHTKDVLDDFGKSMIVMKLMKEHEQELNYYGSMVGKQGFVQEVKSILSEFYQYQITESILENTIQKLDPNKSLYHKLNDLKLLLHSFEEEISNSYMVAEQYLSLLKDVISQSKLLEGADIYFDGYTGFTPVQYSVIEALMNMNCNLYFSLTMDADLFGNNEYGEQGLFSLSKQTVDELCKLAQRSNTVVLPHISFEMNYRLDGRNGLQHLERQLFRFPIQSYEEETDEVVFWSARNVKKEIAHIAKRIQKLVAQKGYRYRDIAIISGDTGAQKDVWKQTMESFQIPYFLDFSESMVNNPLAEMLQQIKLIIETDYAYDCVFSLLKMGYFDIEWEAIYALENYVKKYGVKGYSWWNKAFRGNQKGLRAVNETRALFMNKMEPLMVAFSNKEQTAKDYILAVHNFMLTNKMGRKLYEKSVAFERSGDIRQAKAYSQVYEKFLTVLDKLMTIFGETSMEANTFLEVLSAGVMDMKLGVIPSTIDQVVIGDVERTRLSNIKVLFVAGLNDGVFPENGSSKGILGDRDREQLKEMEVVMAPNSKEEMYLLQFYFYLQTTKPSDVLFLSYREEELTGGALSTSYYFTRMQSLFPKNTFCQWDEKDFSIPMTKEVFQDYFVNELCKLEENEVEDGSFLQVMKQEYPEDYDQIISGYLYQNQDSVLTKKLARQLYGEHMVHSVSRLESYSGCAYQFFLRYGLKLQKPEIYTVEASNVGTILHAVMENFFTWVRDEKIQLKDVEEEALNKRIEQLTIEAAKEENETIFESDFRNQHMLHVMVRIAKRSVQNLCRHLEMGDMKPTYFEEAFSPEKQLKYIHMSLEDGITMEMNGVVDRVDIKETEDAVYFKVIDYKSGPKDIDFVKMYEGRQLQLTVYMSVMEEILKKQYPNKRIIPTGMYYYHLADPIIEAVDATKIEEERVKESRLSGLINSEDTSLDLMDHKTGEVVKVTYKNDGSIRANNKSVVTTEDLTKIADFVREKMMDIGNEIVDGKIPVNPEKGDKSSPCKYCDYKSVCRFEVGLGGNEYRIAPQLKSEEAKQIILGKNEEE